MHSFVSFGALAFGLLSMTGSAFASEAAGDMSHLVARQRAPAAPRGRPNHAIEYGYPHMRGDHSGTRAPVPPQGPPMSPGGYMDPRPANNGAVCRANNQCSTNVAFATARCVRGACAFACIPGFNNVRGACTPAGAATGRRCNASRQCTTGLRNASGLCQGGFCTYQCNAGFYTRGSACVRTSNACGGTTCPAVPGGYNVCVRGACTPQCERYLGYQLHSNGAGGFTCLNTGNDAANCGAAGTVCPAGYNGLGRPVCNNGACALNCGRLRRLQQPDGTPYCAA